MPACSFTHKVAGTPRDPPRNGEGDRPPQVDGGGAVPASGIAPALLNFATFTSSCANRRGASRPQAPAPPRAHARTATVSLVNFTPANRNLMATVNLVNLARPPRHGDEHVAMPPGHGWTVRGTVHLLMDRPKAGEGAGTASDTSAKGSLNFMNFTPSGPGRRGRTSAPPRAHARTATVGLVNFTPSNRNRMATVNLVNLAHPPRSGEGDRPKAGGGAGTASDTSAPPRAHARTATGNLVNFTPPEQPKRSRPATPPPASACGSAWSPSPSGPMGRNSRPVTASKGPLNFGALTHPPRNGEGDRPPQVDGGGAGTASDTSPKSPLNFLNPTPAAPGGRHIPEAGPGRRATLRPSAPPRLRVNRIGSSRKRTGQRAPLGASVSLRLCVNPFGWSWSAPAYGDTRRAGPSTIRLRLRLRRTVPLPVPGRI
jgi:hypothetical protein